MNPKHTPTPWHVDQSADRLHILCARRGTIAEVFAYGSTLDTQTPKANAAFVCLAVNNHNKLREALRAIKARINGEWDNPALVAFGALLPNTEADCIRIAELALKESEAL